MRLHHAALAVLAPILILSGCDGTSGFRNNGTASEPYFGDIYEIVTGPTPDSPHEPPAVDGDSLFASVEYPGGCRDHDFRLGHQLRRDTLFVWITHDANGDNCEALIFEQLAFRAPDDVRDAASLLLLSPSSDHPFVLSR